MLYESLLRRHVFVAGPRKGVVIEIDPDILKLGRDEYGEESWFAAVRLQPEARETGKQRRVAVREVSEQVAEGVAVQSTEVADLYFFDSRSNAMQPFPVSRLDGSRELKR